MEFGLRIGIADHPETDTHVAEIGGHDPSPELVVLRKIRLLIEGRGQDVIDLHADRIAEALRSQIGEG